MALVNGGAIVDFRTRDGSTAVHRAVARNNPEALRTLLDLGASPNYKDSRQLTPLYLCVAGNAANAAGGGGGAAAAAAAAGGAASGAADVEICEMLLHDRAAVGAQNLQGWQEVHQVSVFHSRNLLYFKSSASCKNNKFSFPRPATTV